MPTIHNTLQFIPFKSHNWMPTFWRDMQPLSSWMKNYI